MADARVLVEEETECAIEEYATEEPTTSLLSINAKNQFKWNGSVELFESFLYQKFGLLADDVARSNNGTCTVWKTPSVTFNLYATKTLLVQGKAVDYTRDLLLRTIQAVQNQNSAESPDETTHFADEHSTGGEHQQVRLMSTTATADTRNDHSLVREGFEVDEVALGENENKNESESESESESFEHAQHALNTGEVLINNLSEKFSKEIAKIWSEISGIKSSLTNRDGLRPLQQELDELRLKCTTYESTIDHLEKERASLLEVIKILSSDQSSGSHDPQPASADQSSGSHDQQPASDDWQPVKSNKSNNPKRGKKKKKGKASSQNQQLQTENNDTSENGQGEQKPNEGTIIVGDSIVKGLRKDLLSRAAKRRVTVRSFPGATTTDMEHYLQPSLATKPKAIILHVGTNDLKSSSSARNVAEKIVDLGNMIATNSPNTSVTISAITQRSDEQSLKKKVKDCNKVLKTFCNQNGWGFVEHLNIDETCLNNYKLHLNKKGIAILASNFVNNIVH